MSRDMNLPSGLRPDSTWLPVDRVLEKPVDPACLMSEIERVLSERRGANGTV